VFGGELCCLQVLDGGRVRCRFDRMSAFMVAGPPHRPAHGLTVTLVVFDVLAAGGKTPRSKPWVKRRRKLDRLLADASGPVRATPFFNAADPAAHRLLIADGWEGTVAKRTTSRYVLGRRSAGWVKVTSPAARERDRRRILASLQTPRSSAVPDPTQGGPRMLVNPTAVVFVAVCMIVGDLLGAWVLGLLVAWGVRPHRHR
jgi:hypothetical protein